MEQNTEKDLNLRSFTALVLYNTSSFDHLDTRTNGTYVPSAFRGARTHDHKIKSLALYQLS